MALLAAAAMAAEKPFAAPEVVQHTTPSTAGSLAQVTVSLLLVLAIVFAAAWLMRRLRGFGGLGANTIQIIADAPLGAKERAVLIQVGQQQLLLGVAPGRINTLHVLAEPVSTVNPAAHGAAPATSQQGAVDFKAILKRSLGL